jgi:galactitol-specific phosphotransferase system IIB component
MGKGKQGKILIWFTCPAGAGSSTMIMLQAKDYLQSKNLLDKVELEAMSLNFAKNNSADILVGTLNLAESVKGIEVPFVGLKNVMSNKEYEEKLLPLIQEILEKEGMA